jgi:hypothetical protein
MIQALFLLCLSAQAYSPPYTMILSRTAENHGRGTFVIEDEVAYRDGTNLQLVRETWTVLDENRMKVSFEGEGALKDQIKGSFIYENRNRLSNETGATKPRRLTENWLEPLFYFKSSKTMRSRLVQLKFAPPESLKDRPVIKPSGGADFEPESYVKLTREKGMVAWAISKDFDSHSSPELWVEQDQFVVTKIRQDASASIDADDYAKFDGGLYFPRSRTYHWNDKTVTIQLLSIKSLGTSKGKDPLAASSLSPFRFSGSDPLKEFYLRFR